MNAEIEDKNNCVKANLTFNLPIEIPYLTRRRNNLSGQSEWKRPENCGGY